MNFETLDQVGQSIAEINAKIAEFAKTVTTGDTAFPVRENLAAQARLVAAIDTPLLNRLPTRPGSGKAAAWKEITSLGDDPSTGGFYAEGGAPSGSTTVYADRSEIYKLIAIDGGVTSYAIAAGANFQDQLGAEKNNKLLHLKTLEENAIINADGTGNAFTGLLTQIATGYGSYVAAKTTGLLDDVDNLLKSAWDKGAEINVLVVRSAEAKAISDAIVKTSTTTLRVSVDTQIGITGGFFVNRYVSPIDGRQADILPSKKLATGTIIGLCERAPIPVTNQFGWTPVGDKILVAQPGIFLDVLLDYALSDVPTSNDSVLFRVKRYETLCIPARKFCGTITGF